jgi:dinuclear metal center YbgI/SA1388 family protein
MTTIRDVIQHLELIAPPALQESYDNAGLITGDASQPVTGVITCLDSTEAVVQEAIDKGCNLVVAHHPIVFKGLKRLTGRTYVERTIIKAIRHGIAIYAAHTNLDNVAHQGVNQRIADTLGLKEQRILAAKAVQVRMQITLSVSQWETLRPRLQAANLSLPISHQASWNALSTEGGSLRIQVSLPAPLQSTFSRIVLETIPQATIEMNQLQNINPHLGSGMIGQLDAPMEEVAFLKMVKESMQAGVVRHTSLRGKPIQKVALCGGAGGFLLGQAIRQGADIFITADYKYHEFFDADGQIVIADIGHFESEQYTIQLLKEIISEKFTNFAVYCTEVRTNPVHYL